MVAHKEYIGTIAAPFDVSQKRNTKNGWYLDFGLDVGGKIMPCRVWEEVFDATQQLWEAGKKLAIFGYLAGEQLRVKIAREAEKPALEKHLAFNGQTKEEAHAEVKERIKTMAEKGFDAVWVDGAMRFLPQRDCVRVEGRAHSKLEFAIDRLGAPYVAYKLRSHGFIRIGAGSVTSQAGFSARYREVLDGLVREAQSAEAEPF